MKKKRMYLAFSIIVLIVSVLLQVFESFYALDRSVMDKVYQREDVASNHIKIIAIDEKTLEVLGPFGTWSRSVYGDLLTKLHEQEEKPEMVVFDITYSGEMDASGDLAFAKAAKESGNVVVANNVAFIQRVETKEDGSAYVNDLAIEEIEEPYSELQEVTTQGFSDAILDKDGKVRQAFLRVFHEGKEYPSLAYAVIQKHNILHDVSWETPHVNDKQIFGFSYTAQSGDYEVVSLIDVLEGKVDARIFKDSIVMVGAYASGLQDAYSVPISGTKQMYGVEIHANIIEALLKGNIFQQVGLGYVLLYIVLFLSLFLVLLPRLKVVWGTVFLVCMSTLHLGIGMLLYHNHYEMPLVTLEIMLIVAFVCHVAMEYFMERRNKRNLVKTFKKYVAPQVVEEIVQKGTFQISLGGESKDIAVMFVDIRGFTSLSEKLEAEEVVEILNRYLNVTTKAIFEHKGTLDKFIGDATMAVFNSPFDLDDYVYRAVSTAWQIAQNSEKIGQYTLEKYGVKVGFGIGVHCGKAIIGNIGSETRMDFTAIGDTVNTASRLESNAKAGQVLISEEIQQRLSGRIEVKTVGKYHLKGKRKEMELYEVCGVKGGEEKEDE